MVFDPRFDNTPVLLERVARAAGASPDLTQGGGGNVSVKTGPEKMLIKASGVRLRDVSASGGYALVNYGNIRRYISGKPGSEAEFSDYINSQAMPVKGIPQAKPSIETGFHSLLNEVVVHTHSVYANVLCDSVEGEKVAEALFPGSVMAHYCSPGRDLCAFISARAARNTRQIFFLRNHGLVVSHPGAQGALDLNAEVNSAIKKALKLPPYPADPGSSSGLSARNMERLSFYGRDFILNNVLSPDQALYCGPRELEGQGDMSSVNEVLAACFYVLDCIRSLGFTPKFLTAADVRNLQNLKSGRYSSR